MDAGVDEKSDNYHKLLDAINQSVAMCGKGDVR